MPVVIIVSMRARRRSNNTPAGEVGSAALPTAGDCWGSGGGGGGIDWGPRSAYTGYSVHGALL